MKERAAGFTVDVMSVSPLPVLFQVIFILQDLTRGQKHVTAKEKHVFGRQGKSSCQGTDYST